jgi:cytochrome P450
MRYDPFSPSVREDPYPYYARLRAEAPVFRCEPHDFWVVSRHADVVHVLSNPADFSSAKSVGPDKIPGVPMMLTRDPPEHTRLRSLVGRAFTPRTVAELAPRVHAVADRLVGRAVEQGAFDLVSAVAGPLPLVVIAEILGVSTDRSDDIARWSDATFEQLGGRVTPEGFGRYMQAWGEFKAFLAPEIEARRAAPRGDLLSVLCAAGEDGGTLSTSEILNFALLLLAAGNETATNLIGNAVAALVAHPTEADRVRRDPALVPSAIEEVLRFESPVQGLFRTTTRDVTLRGRALPADTKVMVLYASANRDPEQFPDPDRFDVGRSPNRHLAFGHGIHFCLGAQLARLEARAALEALLRRTSSIRLDPRELPSLRQSPLLRGFERLPVVVEPAARRAGPPSSGSHERMVAA